jgi:hypothetical protein
MATEMNSSPIVCAVERSMRHCVMGMAQGPPLDCRSSTKIDCILRRHTHQDLQLSYQTSWIDWTAVLSDMRLPTCFPVVPCMGLSVLLHQCQLQLLDHPWQCSFADESVKSDAIRVSVYLYTSPDSAEGRSGRPVTGARRSIASRLYPIA